MRALFRYPVRGRLLSQTKADAHSLHSLAERDRELTRTGGPRRSAEAWGVDRTNDRESAQLGLRHFTNQAATRILPSRGRELLKLSKRS